jgi:hypothetical protein
VGSLSRGKSREDMLEEQAALDPKVELGKRHVFLFVALFDRYDCGDEAGCKRARRREDIADGYGSFWKGGRRGHVVCAWLCSVMEKKYSSSGVSKESWTKESGGIYTPHLNTYATPPALCCASQTPAPRRA